MKPSPEIRSGVPECRQFARIRPGAAVAWEDTEPAMERLDVAQMSRLEQANIDLVLKSLRIDPAYCDVRPLIRF